MGSSLLRLLERLFFTPWPARRATIAVVIGGLALAMIQDRSAAMRAEAWGVDEGQRIAESYFLRLLEEGEIGHPDWFRVVTDSSHPQMNKYFFGLAIQVHGAELPRDLALPRYYESGGLAETGWTPPPHLLPTYRPMLRPARRAAMLCSVVSCMTVAWLLLRWFGLGAPLLATTLFLRHYLPVTLMARARSDALQTCAFTLTLIPLWKLWSGGWRGRWGWAHAAFLGVLAAISFQTRLNGLLALGVAGLVLLILAFREKSRGPVVLAVVMTICCLIVSVLSNPYYWARPRAEPGVAAEYRNARALPLRVADRFALQIRDSQRLLGHNAKWRLPGVTERVRFVSSVLFSGVAGKVILTGALLAFLALFAPSLRERVLLPCLWATAVVGVFTLWVPLSWEPYVLLIFPAAILLGATGWSALVLLVWSAAARAAAF